MKLDTKKSSEKKNCAVIGSGIAGLAAAIRVAAKGYEVDLYESNNYPGGKIREHTMDRYRFDMGPSVITLPGLIDELFELHGKNPRDYFEISKLEEPFRYFFSDGSILNSFANTTAFADEIVLKTNDTKDQFEKYLEDIRTKYKITQPVFIENSIHRFKDFLNWDSIYGLIHFHKIDAFRSMDQTNKKFFNDPKLIALLNYYATYVGSNPFAAPGTLNVIAHLEINEGLYMPDLGIYSLLKALTKLASEVGVRLHYQHTVEQIVVENKRATGIRVNGETRNYGLVISNMDVNLTYTKLLPNAKKPKRVLDQPKSGSVIGFYWGINRSFPELKLHNMLFSKNQKEEYQTLFDKKELYSDPSLYIYISKKHVAEDAPEGHENWFVLITAPNNTNQNWEELKKKARENAILKINNMLNCDISENIVCEESIDPKRIEADYSCALGAVYGNSSNGKLAAFSRHANFSRKIRNLYFVGGSVHPGAGVPLCLQSAKIVDKLISER